MELAHNDCAPGDLLPPLCLPPVTRHMLALYCGASGDHNPLHTDIDFARAAGLPDVIAHGMLSMAFLGRMLTNWAPQENLRSFGVRFVRQVNIGDRLSCSGAVAEVLQSDGEQIARLTIEIRNQDDATVLAGDAEIAIAGVQLKENGSEDGEA